MQHILLITGGSKGIGKALAKKYLDKGFQVFSISRTFCDLEGTTNIQGNLAETQEIPAYFEKVLTYIDLEKISSFTLINNAGSLGTIGNIEKNTPTNISQTVNINLTAPLILSLLFIKKLQVYSFSKKIISISSGAAIKPYPGWSSYCSTKAGLDMMTKTIAEEQKPLAHGVKLTAIYPGVVETAMQKKIRATSKKDFKNVQRFIDLKENNELYTPDYVANKIYELDINNILENGDVIDIRKI
ncbi:SDR family NAD(P)-dependent oxidoreductase [Bacteroidota bacterium]